MNWGRGVLGRVAMTLQAASSSSLFQNKPVSCWTGLSPAAGKVCASAAEAPVLERAYTKIIPLKAA